MGSRAEAGAAVDSQQAGFYFRNIIARARAQRALERQRTAWLATHAIGNQRDTRVKWAAYLEPAALLLSPAQAPQICWHYPFTAIILTK